MLSNLVLAQWGLSLAIATDQPQSVVQAHARRVAHFTRLLRTHGTCEACHHSRPITDWESWRTGKRQFLCVVCRLQDMKGLTGPMRHVVSKRDKEPGKNIG